MSSFDTVKAAMTTFNNVLKEPRVIIPTDSAAAPVPYFLYVITQDETGKLISMAIGDENIDVVIKPVTIESSSPENTSISDVIKANISKKLQELYASTTSSKTSTSTALVPHYADIDGGSRKRHRKHKRRHNTKRRNRK